MSACTEVKRWMTEEVQLPVESAIYGFRESCTEARRAIQEEVVRPATDWVRREEHRCREQECNWWCLCCNKWLCWIAVVVIKIITWVVVTVVKWVVTIVCQVVAFIVDFVVKLVLRILKFLVSFFVCLVSDWEGWELSFGDFWSDMMSIGDGVVDFLETLLDDVVGILGDLGTFLLDLGESFGPVGIALAGILAGALQTVGELVATVSSTISAIDDLVVGLMTGNLCRASAGLTNFGVSVGRMLLTTTNAFGRTFGGGKRAFDWLKTRKIVEEWLERTFMGDELRLERSKERCRLSAFPSGLPFTIDARRMVIRSGEFLRDLHNNKKLDLYELAGHVSECKAGWATSTRRKAGEVVYRGTDTRVSYSDLNTFLRDGADAVPPFDVYPIKLADFRTYLEWARDRGHEIGVDLRHERIGELEITGPFTSTSDPLATPIDAGLQDLFDAYGRTGTPSDPLGIIPAVAVFWFTDPDANGWTSWYRPEYEAPCGPSGANKSGVAFIGRTPEWVFRSVLVHEIGHYLGLCHEHHDGVEYIMFSPRESDYVRLNTVIEYVTLGTGPHFTETDTNEVWRWITTVAKDSVLP